jgi:hypothetical protein
MKLEAGLWGWKLVWMLDAGGSKLEGSVVDNEEPVASLADEDREEVG